MTTRRVCVWWPTTDRLYAGLVTQWSDGVHRVQYDDGDVSEWSLYWESGAPGFALEESDGDDGEGEAQGGAEMR